MQHYDVIVIGGGHAGCEAAYAAARRGCRTLMLAMDLAGVGAMSCNPAIGGVGKGHLVREVDAFAGVIGQAADAAAIHYRMLNRSKGPAVHGPRVQADRGRFARAVRLLLDAQPHLTIAAGEVVSLTGIGTAGPINVGLSDASGVVATSVILCSGTFLGGRLFRGEERMDGGRLGERASHPLAAVVADLGLKTRRFKTGTPPRLDARQIDWSRVGRQDSDRQAWRMSLWSSPARGPMLFCGITRTNARSHAIIRGALHTSPLADGAITGTGPRYCPSIEDKVHRFGDRDGHQIFLEPESADGRVIYPNGISTSLATEPQRQFVRTISGLERCDVVEPGYAVEYVSIDARSCDAGLMVAAMPGLFLAGQITGTTGYEEAAAQGLVAGLNAAAFARGLQPVRFERDASYIGVLIDDLTLQEVTEPYRMLTARAENRLWLRADNAERRMCGAVIASGVLSVSQAAAAMTRRDRYDQARRRLASGADAGASEDPSLLEAAADELYRPYIKRAKRQSDQIRKLERPLTGIDYRAVRGLSGEMVERLELSQPASVAEASRVAGVTPGAVTALLAAARRE